MRKSKPQPEGLIGLFGHTYIADPDNADATIIQCQFQIIRKMDGDRYVVQYFSWLDGSSTECGVYPESQLLGPDVKLYANQELWLAAERAGAARWYNAAA
jgi:hypothetical protein